MQSFLKTCAIARAHTSNVINTGADIENAFRLSLTLGNIKLCCFKNNYLYSSSNESINMVISNTYKNYKSYYQYCLTIQIFLKEWSIKLNTI